MADGKSESSHADADGGDYYVEQTVEWMPVKDLIPYDRNAKLHDNMIAYLKNTIKRVKFRTPIYIDSNNVIIAGHARRLAAIELGMTKVPVIRVTDMTEDEIRMWRLEDNRLTELSDYDLPTLGLEVKELKELGWDLESFGLDFDFDFDESFDELEAGEVEETEEWDGPENESFSDEDEAVSGSTYEPPDDEPFTKPGDIILMGEHRLICGDSTDPAVIKRVLDGGVADITFTSPPYNAGHLTNVRKPKEGAKYVDTEDLRDEGEYEEFLFDVIDNLLETSEEIFINIGLLAGSKSAIVHLLNKYMGNFKDIVYWHKTNPVPAVKEGVITSSVELIICLGKNGSRQFRHKHKLWYGFIEGTVSMHNPYHTVHKATFPLYLPTEIIDVFTEEHDTVMDCFAGTGTTLIACCDTDRVFRGVELVPLYCDIIVQRYMDHTGDTDVAVVRDNKRIKFPVRD